MCAARDNNLLLTPPPGEDERDSNYESSSDTESGKY